MKENNVIDISGINNYWIVYLMPFAKEERNEKYVQKYQQYCIENCIFGMGWSDCKNDELIKLLQNKSINSKIDEKLIRKYKEIFGIATKAKIGESIIELYKEAYKKLNNNRISSLAMNNFQKIQENDFVIMRLKDGYYYIAQVKKNNKKEDICVYSDGSDKEKIKKISEQKSKSCGFSWYCEVNEWYQFSEQEMPEDIVGRFSQRMHQTIQHINDDRIKLLMTKLLKDNIRINIPKITLNESNFARTLNYMELENLVCEYILQENQNYRLLPSKCKISKPNYEFDLINADDINEKYITCQVKNQEEVLYTNYIEDAKRFKKIYLFSGISKYINRTKEYKEKTNEEIAIEEIEKSENIKDIIKIIPKKKLFDFFKKSLTLNEIKSRKKEYYEIIENSRIKMDEIQEKLEKANWKRVHKKFSKGEFLYKKSINAIEFKNIPCQYFYYNDDFGSFIKKNIPDNEKNKNEIEERIRQVLKIIYD